MNLNRPFSGMLAIILSVFATHLHSQSVTGLILPLHEVKVGTAVPGIVKSVKVQEGDDVTKGQPLALLDDDLEKLDVERTAKVLEKARFDHEAAQQLLLQDVGSKESALTKSIEYDLARLQHEAAKVKLQQRTITAPLDGILVKRGKEPGEPVLLNEAVFEIVHIRQVYAQFYLEPALVHGLKTGSRHALHLPSMKEGSRVEGMVVFIDSRLDAESGLYRVKLLVDNPKLEIKAGMRVECNFGDSSNR